ncbi:MAG: hypothetical protein ACR2OZ_01075 [Verrucomicrobiales bacterium]
MRVLVGAILFLFTGLAATRAAGFSVGIDIEGDVFAYELRATDTKELLFWAPTSYQPEGTGSRDFCLHHTKGAKIEWNGDRSAVAITESNHRFIGHVLLLQQSSSRTFENVLTPAVEAQIRKETKLNWERCRFYFDRWLERDVAAVHLTGLYYTDEAKGRLCDRPDYPSPA